MYVTELRLVAVLSVSRPEYKAVRSVSVLVPVREDSTFDSMLRDVPDITESKSRAELPPVAIPVLEVTSCCEPLLRKLLLCV